MDTLPLTITAMAAVRSKRANYVPPFEPRDPARPAPVKHSFADADLVRAAVVALKAKGFQIGSVHRFGVYVSGPPELYMKTFAVTLEIDAASRIVSVKGGSRAGYIDTAQTPDLKDLLAGMAFSGPEAAFGDESPPPKAKPWQLYLDQVPGNLRGGTRFSTSGDVKVWVVDSGFSVNHPWFDALGPADASWRKVHEYKIPLPVQDEESELALFEQELEDPDSVSPQERERRRIESSERVEVELSLKDPFRDPGNHGTAVLANLLAVAPAVHAAVARVFPPYSMSSCLADIATMGHDAKRIIVSLSLGPRLGAVEVAEDRVWRDVLELASHCGVLVVAATGNKHGELPRWIRSEVPLIVAACARELNGTISTGSTIAIQAGAGMRSIPDICALGGTVEQDTGYVYCPKGLPGDVKWSPRTGSSFATPQVAAVCAMVWSACAAATAAQVKEILMATAVPIDSEATADATKLRDIQHRAGGRLLSPGLAHINRAVWLAHAVTLSWVRDASMSIAQVLQEPRWRDALAKMGMEN